MKIKLLDVENAWNTLVKLADRDLPVKSAFKLGKIIKILGEEKQNIENVKLKLFKKYGEKSEEHPEQLVVPQEKMESLVKELNDVLSMEVEVNIELLNMEFFDEISYINLTGRECSFLLPLMKEND